VFGLNNHFDFSASAAAPKIIHRSPLFHHRSASLVRERLASVATESDAGHTLLPNQKSELAFCGTRKTSHLWRLVENEVYDERLELRRWYLTFAKHDACISEGGPSCRCVPLKPIGSVFESWYKRGPEQSPGPLFSAALLQCTAWIAFPRAPSSRHVEVTRPDVEPATGIIKPGSAGGPH
jgi:hypothetical protein